jgi:hypothetical protein
VSPKFDTIAERKSSVNGAARVIAKFGGQNALARALATNQSTVQHWAKSGHIPAWRHADILRAASERAIPLDPRELSGRGDPVRPPLAGPAQQRQPVSTPNAVAGPPPVRPAPSAGHPSPMAAGLPLAHSMAGGVRPPQQGPLQHGRADPAPGRDPEIASMREEIGELRDAVRQLVEEVRALRRERRDGASEPDADAPSRQADEETG